MSEEFIAQVRRATLIEYLRALVLVLPMSQRKEYAYASVFNDPELAAIAHERLF